jgi:A/G-specific adenine glycosylase
MPWKGEKDPYKIWLSEIILQQTRVEQGVSYYWAFINRFSTINKLAEATDDEVYKLWEGLGYYSRCKNLLHSARVIANENGGVFPSTYEDILKLKGVGPYTAAAISSFAFGLPYAVLDGNVFRVLSRYFGIELPIDSTDGRKYFTSLAQSLIDINNPAAYNQAIMDFGATICKPKIPECQQCILKSKCIAYEKAIVNKLPIKKKQLLKKHRWFYYFIFNVGDKILVNKRTSGDIWENLHEFFLFESDKLERWTEEKISIWLKDQLGISKYQLSAISPVYKQLLTHQVINGQFINIELYKTPESLRHLKSFGAEELKALSFPRFINQHFDLANTKG